MLEILLLLIILIFSISITIVLILFYKKSKQSIKNFAMYIAIVGGIFMLFLPFINPVTNLLNNLPPKPLSFKGYKPNNYFQLIFPVNDLKITAITSIKAEKVEIELIKNNQSIGKWNMKSKNNIKWLYNIKLGDRGIEKWFFKIFNKNIPKGTYKIIITAYGGSEIITKDIKIKYPYSIEYFIFLLIFFTPPLLLIFIIIIIKFIKYIKLRRK